MGPISRPTPDDRDPCKRQDRSRSRETRDVRIYQRKRREGVSNWWKEPEDLMKQQMAKMKPHILVQNDLSDGETQMVVVP